MSKKPYRFEHQEWLELSQRRDWNDSQFNPDDLAEYSEFQRPYALPAGEDSYPAWEFGWPDITFPDILPIIVPDPIDNPCSISGDCTWAKIIGTASIKCGGCRSYTQIHVWLGCTVAPWWAAFGEWILESADNRCHLVSANPVMALVCCDDDAGVQTLTLTYQGALSCVDSLTIEVTDCDTCCEGLEIQGDWTVGSSSTWTGTITPACPGATCEISSNSGCDLTCNVNPAGSQVSFTTSGDCGTATVTVTAPENEECEGQESAIKKIAITGGGGGWFSVHGCPPNPLCDSWPICGSRTSAEQHISACTDQVTGFRWGGGPNCSFNTIGLNCRGCTGWQPPCPAAANEYPTCINRPNCEERDFNINCHGADGREHCTKWNCNKCQWVCSC